MEEKKQSGEREETSNSVWEWLVAAVGLILVAGAIGATIYRAVTKADTPPTLAVTVDSIERRGEMFLVKFTVKNTGGQTAAAVQIEGELKTAAQIAETAEATLDYAPAGSIRRGGLFFKQDPQNSDLQIRVKGYEEP